MNHFRDKQMSMMVKYFETYLKVPFAGERIASDRLKTVVVSGDLPNEWGKPPRRNHEKARFDFDSTGRLLKMAIWDDHWCLHRETTEYAYDGAGNLIWEQTRKTWYPEDKAQREYAEGVRSKRSSGGEYVEQTLIYAWRDGRCVSKTTEKPEEDKDPSRLTENYLYNARGQKTETHRTRDGSDTPEWTEICRYDVEGNLIYRFDQSNNEEQTNEYECQYDTEGRLTEEKHTYKNTYNEASELRWYSTRIVCCAYNAKGNLIHRKTVEEAQSGGFDEDYESLFFYNEQNQLIREIWPMQYEKGTTLYFYDDAERLVRKEISVKNATDIMEYRYDEKGLCIAIIKNSKPEIAISYTDPSHNPQGYQ